MIRPFILSQVGEKQNELIFSPYAINLLKLSEVIYEFFDKLNKTKSFFRCVKCNDQIISAYYWKSCVPEPKSGRMGLYVVIGFLMPMNEFNFGDFWKFSSSFFKVFEKFFDVNLKSNISDRFFLKIQENTIEKMEAFLEKYNSFLGDYVVMEKMNNTFKLHVNFGIPRHTDAFIYMMNRHKNFYDDWAAFIYESYLIMNKSGKQDVLSIKGYTKSSFRILQNGEKIYNRYINKIVVSKNPVCRYLIIYLQNQ